MSASFSGDIFLFFIASNIAITVGVISTLDIPFFSFTRIFPAFSFFLSRDGVEGGVTLMGVSNSKTVEDGWSGIVDSAAEDSLLDTVSIGGSYSDVDSIVGGADQIFVLGMVSPQPLILLFQSV